MSASEFLEIGEVGERAQQGQANAYRCVTTDGAGYYAKGVGATQRGLVCEWVAGRLAQELRLPIAPLALLHLDEKLAQALPAPARYHLTGGTVFGSRVVANAREFDPTLIRKCSPAFRLDLVAFDWWVRNADRTLGQHSGNPNLLWNVADEQPVVIDHNLAFDLDFDAASFRQTHVFGIDQLVLWNSSQLQAAYEQRFARVLGSFDDIWGELPQNWLQDEDGKTRFAASEFLAILARVHRPRFWD